MKDVRKFTTEALMRVMAPLDSVIENFQYNYECQLSLTSVADDDVPSTFTEEGQGAFAGIIWKILHYANGEQAQFLPTNRYIRKLLQRYASKVESFTNLENEDLVELISEYQFKPVGDGMPNPHDSCHISFSVGCQQEINREVLLTNISNSNLVGIKVYPHHNDVGVRRIWEAAAALVEYVLQHPELIKGKRVVELGAGVGFTGILLAGLCGPKTVHMTDYTDATLRNLEYNVAVNMDWIKAQHKDGEGSSSTPEVTMGYLEWGEFGDNFCSSMNSADINTDLIESIRQPDSISTGISKKAEVVIAGDVEYDVKENPALVSTLDHLLSDPSCERIAIFATLLRNQATFALFKAELESKGIICSFARKDDIDSLDHLFPCYYDQPRSDIRICIMTKNKY